MKSFYETILQQECGVCEYREDRLDEEMLSMREPRTSISIPISQNRACNQDSCLLEQKSRRKTL